MFIIGWQPCVYLIRAAAAPPATHCLGIHSISLKAMGQVLGNCPQSRTFDVYPAKQHEFINALECEEL